MRITNRLKGPLGLVAAALTGAVVSLSLASYAGPPAPQGNAPTDEGRKVIVSNTSEKPVFVQVTGLPIQVSATNFPSEIRVQPRKYVYEWYSRDRLMSELARPGSPPPTGEALAAFLTARGEIVEDLSSLASVVGARVDGVMLRREQ